jgi:large subunit ribosomal protein L24
MLPSRSRIRKGDLVAVTAGKERGKQGKVLRVNPETARVFVEKLNIIKKHSRPSPSNPKGGIVEKEGGIHLSNVMLVCGNCGKRTRIAMKMLPEGKKIRQCARCKEVVDKEAR